MSVASSPLVGLIRFRRMFGLFAFFYVALHFLTYIWLDKFFDLREMLADVARRKFITAVVHTTAYLAVAGLLAWVVYSKLGLAFLRKVLVQLQPGLGSRPGGHRSVHASHVTILTLRFWIYKLGSAARCLGCLPPRESQMRPALVVSAIQRWTSSVSGRRCM